MLNFRHILVLWFSLSLLATGGVASAGIADNWASGQQAFNDGNYASALHFFESARDAGLDGPAVHYNIAVSQFRLERYEDAGRTFALIARWFPQMRGLAEYNLGLVARRLGDTPQARVHFLRAYQLSPDNREIRVLASRRLRELEPEVRKVSRWTGAIGIRAGHDDNAALRDEAGLPVGTTTASPMADLFAVVQGPWIGRSGVRLDGSAYLVKYFDADEFDQSQFRGRVFYDWRPDDWRIQIGAHASISTLGSDAFDRKVGVNGSVVRYLGHVGMIDLRYAYDDVSDADAQFAGISGSRQQFDLRYRWYRFGHRVQVHFGLETNDRADPGVSPDRTRFGVAYRYMPDTGLGYGAGIEIRNSEYGDLAIPREEDLLTLSADLTYTLRGDWQLSFELRHSDNDSTDATFSYDRTQVMIGAMKLF
jgi:tetratricopeptide (TPR) repeat protein